MIVDKGQLIRDASGRFGCPNCWYHPNGFVVPTDTNCPNCNEPLEWPEDVIGLHNYYTKHGRRYGMKGG